MASRPSRCRMMKPSRSPSGTSAVFAKPIRSTQNGMQGSISFTYKTGVIRFTVMGPPYVLKTQVQPTSSRKRTVLLEKSFLTWILVLIRLVHVTGGSMALSRDHRQAVHERSLGDLI